MSREEDEARRALLREVVGMFIDHPNWRDSRIARELDLDLSLVTEVRAFALSYPPTDGVKPEPEGDEAEA